MYRYQKLALSAAGIAPVKVPGVEDVDVSSVIKGHQHYSSRIRDCLVKVGLDDCYAPESRRRTDTRASTAVPGAVVGPAGEEEQEQQGQQRQGQLDAAMSGSRRATGAGTAAQEPQQPMSNDSDAHIGPTTILY